MFVFGNRLKISNYSLVFVFMPAHIHSYQRWTPHVTVASVIEQHGRYLLVMEDRRDGIKLNNPAGHLEPGESLVQACARETLEEAAYQFKPTALVGIYLHRFLSLNGQDKTYLRFAFCGELEEHIASRQLDTGIIQAVWMSYEEICLKKDMHRTPLLLQCIDDYRAGKRFPLELITSNDSVWQQFGC